MIRSGEEYTVETGSQFINRTNFTKLDALLANDLAVVSEANEWEEADEEFDSPDEVPQEFIDMLFAELDSPIIPTLRADQYEWVHLREGPVHRIVKLHPEKDSVWAEGLISKEGISLTLYQANMNEPSVVEEFQKPWSDLVPDGDTRSWMAFQDVVVDGCEFTLSHP